MILLTIMSEVINMFVLGITGPTSLVVISIIALIIFGPKNYHNLVEQLVVL